MKLLTRDTDYAIRALCCIADIKNSRATTGSLSKELDMPRPFLRKIFQQLNKKGVVKTLKGKGGGIALVKDPKDITVLEIAEIFQGPFQLNEHTFKGKACPRLNVCLLKKKLDDIEGDVRVKLGDITIASLLK